MVFPPHLPPPSCNIEQHHRWERIKVLVVATAFALFAGIVGALVVIGWVWPNLAEGGSWLVTRSRSAAAAPTDAVQAEAREKFFTIYRKAATINGVVSLARADRLAVGTTVTSDGWLVSYLPGYDGAYQNWIIVGPHGFLYNADQAVFDKRSNMIFVKLASLRSGGRPAGEQFKVATFSTAPERSAAAFVWQDGNWFPTSVVGLTTDLAADSHLDTAPVSVARLQGNFTVGSPVIDDQGDFLGILATTNEILPAPFIGNALQGIQEQGHPVYRSLGAEGWFSDERPLAVNGQPVAGFLVARVLANKSVLRKGDIIEEVDGRSLNSALMWYTNASPKVHVKVLRTGKILEMDVPVISI